MMWGKVPLPQRDNPGMRLAFYLGAYEILTTLIYEASQLPEQQRDAAVKSLLLESEAFIKMDVRK
jgi:hypothetical protein